MLWHRGSVSYCRSTSMMAAGHRKYSIQTVEELSEYTSVSNCCFLCMEAPVNPKLLDCKHAFCEACLTEYYELHPQMETQTGEQTAVLSCPTCRKSTQMPAVGISGFKMAVPGYHSGYSDHFRQFNSHAADSSQRCDVCLFKEKCEEADFYCSKCGMNLCEGCNGKHEQQLLFREHQVVHISNKEVINLYCDRHNKMPCRYFCTECKLPCCNVCLLETHATHHAVTLRDSLASHRDNLRTLLNSLGPTLDKMESKVKRLSHVQCVQSKHRNGLQEPPAAVDHRPLRHSMEHQHSFDSPYIGHNMSKMLSHSQSFPNTSDALMQHQQPGKAPFHTQLHRTRQIYDMATRILDMSQSKRLLAIYDDIVARIQTVLEVELSDLQYLINASLAKELETYQGYLGRVTPPSQNSSMTSLGDSKTNLSSSNEDTSLDDFILDDNQQSLLVKPKLVWRTERQRCDLSELYNPCDVAFLHDRSLIVAEYDVAGDRNNRIGIYDAEGKALGALAQGEIRPLGLAVTRDGNIAVTDCKGKRVKIYSPTGQVVTELGKGHFGWPYGIAVNSKGQILITDAFNDTISVYQSDGKRIRQFGSSGSNTMQFRNPYHISCDSNDNIFVSDSGNNCIKVFDIAGHFKFKAVDAISRHHASTIIITGRKSRRRRLKAPRGVSIDLKGNLLVADDFSRVCMFDSSGGYVRNLLTEEDLVKYPEAISCSPWGQIAITEYNPNNMFAIKVFNMYE